MEEIWKSVAGYEGKYEVSNLGRVKGLCRVIEYYNPKTQNINKQTISEKIMTISDNGKGYKKVNLSKENKVTQRYVHRLVAEAFIPNPLNKPEVNHIDYDKSNNKLDNLEWVTSKENNAHSIPNKNILGLRNKVIAWNDKEEIVIDNLKKWCIENKHDRASVYRVLDGVLITHHGYYFRREGVEKEQRGKNKTLGRLIEAEYPNGIKRVLTEGVTEWCREMGFKSVTSILDVARGSKKSYRGFIFKYVE